MEKPLEGQVEVVGDQQQQQQQDLLLEAKERYKVQDECVVMLLSTVVVDKDRRLRYLIKIFCTVVPESVSTQRK